MLAYHLKLDSNCKEVRKPSLFLDKSSGIFEFILNGISNIVYLDSGPQKKANQIELKINKCFYFLSSILPNFQSNSIAYLLLWMENLIFVLFQNLLAHEWKPIRQPHHLTPIQQRPPPPRAQPQLQICQHRSSPLRTLLHILIRLRLIWWTWGRSQQ